MIFSLHRYLFWFVAGAIAMNAMADTTVKSLDRARGAIKSRDARAAFDREIGGAPVPDGFGTKLPEGFTKGMLAAQLAPGRDPALLILAGARAWPQRAGSYVAIVCFAATAAAASKPPGASAPLQCDSYGGDARPEVWLGVYERGVDGVPHLVARTESAVTDPVDWSSTNIDAPQSLDNDDGKTAAQAVPESWQRFDFARYLLREGEYAFGVRAGWSEGYAGGGASFEALYLFRIDGKSLRVVFAQPMMFSKMLAGDWHKDGTRDHEMSDGSNSLSVLPGTTAGYHDLQLREQGGKARQTFRWSTRARAYVTQAED